MRKTTRAQLAQHLEQQARREHEDRETHRNALRRKGGHRAPKLDGGYEFPPAVDAPEPDEVAAHG